MTLVYANFTVTQGHQVASGIAKDSPFDSGTISLQKPFFEQAGIDLSDMHLATLNAQLNCKAITIKKWDYQLENIKWATNFPAENFNFVACEIEINKQRLPAWIYQPSPDTKIAHFQPENVVELISSYIPDLSYGNQLKIWFDSDKISLLK